MIMALSRQSVGKLRKIYCNLEKDWLVLRVYYQTFSNFLNESKTLPLLRRTGSNFFYFTREAYINEIIMRAYRLLERENTGGNENLTLRYIFSEIEQEIGNSKPSRHEKSFRKKLPQKISLASRYFDKIKIHRNRHLAHTDRSVISGSFDGFTYKELDSTIKELRSIFALLFTYFKGGTESFEVTGHAQDWRLVKKALKLRARERLNELRRTKQPRQHGGFLP